jgi:sucrose-6F-phosphate phosphohydrolase
MLLSLFVTDLDNTLVGDDSAMEELNQYLVQQRDNNGTRIVYATGRSPTLYRQLETQKKLLEPDALVTAVGTEIYFRRNDSPDLDWIKNFGNGWNRDLIVVIASHFPELILQPDTEQRPHKVSYFLKKDSAPKVLEQLEFELNSKGLEIEVVYSDGKDLDILPKKASKGLAISFLQKIWGISSLQTVVCGDSGNDISLFSVGDERGIIVGNAKPELLEWLNLNGLENHYLAKEPCAKGILEGLRHFSYF